MKPFCECEKVTGVLRDMHATCVQCGGRDAYKKSPERNNKASTMNNVTQEQVSEFKEWFNEDDHDLLNYPDEAMQAAWDKASSLKEIKIQELEKQLAESVPKSEIENILANNVTSSDIAEELRELLRESCQCLKNK